MTVELPAFVFWLCGASAALVIALALPLWLRRIPPNALYGARFETTLATPAVWYPVNERAGRDLALLAAGYLAGIVALATHPAGRHPAPLLLATGSFVVVLVAETIRLARFAARLAREASLPQPHSPAS